VLNLVASESEEARKTVAGLSCEKPEHILKDLKKIKHWQEDSHTLPMRHHIKLNDIDFKRLQKIFISTYERKPENFENLLAMKGVGPKTIRALALISELVYGVKYSIRDPARFSFAHGGKDGFPYPVDRENYNRSIDILHRAVRDSKIGREAKVRAIKKLSVFYG
jgi:hypothetical protein